MSGVSAPSDGGFPGLALAIASSGMIQKRMADLTGQAASGYAAPAYAGLGDMAKTALSLTSDISALDATRSGITAAGGGAAVAQTAMTRIQSIAADLFAQMPNLNGLNASEIDTIAAKARDDLSQVADLLNTAYDGVYVFAGIDTANPPIPNPAQMTSSGFYTQIAAAVGGLAANGAAATAASTLAIAGSNAAGTSPFSAFLSQPAAGIARPSVSLGHGQTETIGLTASANANVVSSGSSTTGSYMRDLLRALATVGSLSATQVNAAGFGALVADTQTSLGGAIAAMAADAGVLGEQQSNLTALQSNLGDTRTALVGQLSSAQDVDMAATLSSLTQVQTQLQESYKMISASSGMSLVKFLPA